MYNKEFSIYPPFPLPTFRIALQKLLFTKLVALSAHNGELFLLP
jgi:hypothetical protein